MLIQSIRFSNGLKRICAITKIWFSVKQKIKYILDLTKIFLDRPTPHFQKLWEVVFSSRGRGELNLNLSTFKIENNVSNSLFVFSYANNQKTVFSFYTVLLFSSYCLSTSKIKTKTYFFLILVFICFLYPLNIKIKNNIVLLSFLFFILPYIKIPYRSRSFMGHAPLPIS